MIYALRVAVDAGRTAVIDAAVGDVTLMIDQRGREGEVSGPYSLPDTNAALTRYARLCGLLAALESVERVKCTCPSFVRWAERHPEVPAPLTRGIAAIVRCSRCKEQRRLEAEAQEVMDG